MQQIKFQSVKRFIMIKPDFQDEVDDIYLPVLNFPEMVLEEQQFYYVLLLPILKSLRLDGQKGIVIGIGQFYTVGKKGRLEV